ncbi:hypothetical protein BOTCAL_0318g00110 [Botryotinia calthae]|uniref:Uncharacterized protein n=1 Tax=Botryotinia calthae TaxID=38488 RepID=A0A4Y8CTS2_9HELO|nr:hypothetical protein BOTCAL_0318g00110 [Botryotinia calthae]
MCRSITFRYSICTHSWRPYVIPCSNPVKNNSTGVDTANMCPVYKIRYERRVIKSGNGFCAACWEKQERREKCVEGREKVFGEKIRERIVGGELEGVLKERVENLRGEREGVRRDVEERKENSRRENKESENLLQETEKKTWILEGNGGVRKKADGNEGTGNKDRKERKGARKKGTLSPLILVLVV